MVVLFRQTLVKATLLDSLGFKKAEGKGSPSEFMDSNDCLDRDIMLS